VAVRNAFPKSVGYIGDGVPDDAEQESRAAVAPEDDGRKDSIVDWPLLIGGFDGGIS
jgi:hypothetical protein